MSAYDVGELSPDGKALAFWLRLALIIGNRPHSPAKTVPKAHT